MKLNPEALEVVSFETTSDDLDLELATYTCTLFPTPATRCFVCPAPTTDCV